MLMCVTAYMCTCSATMYMYIVNPENQLYKNNPKVTLEQIYLYSSIT